MISIIGHRGAVLLHTDTVFPVPVQLEPWWTGTLIAAQRVDASVFTASTIYAAFINIYERRRDVWWNNLQANSLNSILLSSNKTEKQKNNCGEKNLDSILLKNRAEEVFKECGISETSFHPLTFWED